MKFIGLFLPFNVLYFLFDINWVLERVCARFLDLFIDHVVIHHLLVCRFLFSCRLVEVQKLSSSSLGSSEIFFSVMKEKERYYFYCYMSYTLSEYHWAETVTVSFNVSFKLCLNFQEEKNNATSDPWGFENRALTLKVGFCWA